LYAERIKICCQNLENFVLRTFKLTNIINSGVILRIWSFQKGNRILIKELYKNIQQSNTQLQITWEIFHQSTMKLHLFVRIELVAVCGIKIYMEKHLPLIFIAENLLPYLRTNRDTRFEVRRAGCSVL